MLIVGLVYVGSKIQNNSTYNLHQLHTIGAVSKCILCINTERKTVQADFRVFLCQLFKGEDDATLQHIARHCSADPRLRDVALAHEL